jgi:hypothetical protein
MYSLAHYIRTTRVLNFSSLGILGFNTIFYNDYTGPDNIILNGEGGVYTTISGLSQDASLSITLGGAMEGAGSFDSTSFLMNGQFVVHMWYSREYN